jgi:hypothetical protein
MKRFATYILVILFVTTSGLSAYSAEKEKVDAKTLFEKKCSICHNLDRAKSKKKTVKEWETTVMRMKNVRGAPINDQETNLIIDYLAKNYGK